MEELLDQPGYKMLSVRLQKDLYDGLQQKAKREDRTISEVVRELVRKFLAS